MAQVEREKKFGEKIWDYAVWGTIGMIAIFAALDILNHHIPLLENSLPSTT